MTATSAAVIGGGLIGGLIGSYLVRLLREERPHWSVRAVDRSSRARRLRSPRSARQASLLSMQMADQLRRASS